ncbi:4-hydroxy-tetrahydrodipicolinate reductase [Candidatus Odyssella acanthamoebae]|uniref:4-hydroxy-tetrahydrodipicolinate reductase n=1 Tax=Candidatus Odyssella acanthamoebae TaxID=91604 RepID=A0A077AX35_9PROT|nr:4-hydroxy-tetrahydrodipicolinate reductase [Candidatus Paracaedibacter acanthamoebae]AIK96183.1 hypothetical protein ID47_04640 [Candidatus Paracaedibacter acanthamoebae]
MVDKTNLYLFGVTGRMGIEISTLLHGHPSATLVGGTSSKGSYGDISVADVLLDFSVIGAIPTILHLATSMQKPLIIGTTGLTKEYLRAVEDTAKSIPVLQATNTSFGVAVIAKLAQLAAQLLDDTYDAEIIEAHHRNKLDAPSGTSLSLGKAVAKGRGHTLDALMADMDRSGRRQEGQIGFSVQRGGGVVGDHIIRFMGDDEIVEVSHKGLSRRLFARGAVKAALWLKEQPAGLYTMQNALGLD